MERHRHLDDRGDEPGRASCRSRFGLEIIAAKYDDAIAGYSAFLQQYQRAAQDVKPADIISPDQVSQAVQINQQLTAAENMLAIQMEADY